MKTEGVQEELEERTTKLRRLARKYEHQRMQMQQAQESHAARFDALQSALAAVQRELGLCRAIIQNFVPQHEVEKVRPGCSAVGTQGLV